MVQPASENRWTNSSWFTCNFADLVVFVNFHQSHLMCSMNKSYGKSWKHNKLDRIWAGSPSQSHKTTVAGLKDTLLNFMSIFQLKVSQCITKYSILFIMFAWLSIWFVHWTHKVTLMEIYKNHQVCKIASEPTWVCSTIFRRRLHHLNGLRSA
jgi:hypothetical protein